MENPALGKTFMNFDSWEKTIGALGFEEQFSKASHQIPLTSLLQQASLYDLYMGSGLASNIVDIVTEDMTRRGFSVTGDTDGDVNAYMEENGLHVGIRELLRWDRLTGGAVGILGVEDGQSDPMLPLNEDNIKSISFINVFDRFRVVWTNQDLYLDPTKPKFGKPQWYTILPLWGGRIKLHESRVIAMDGEPLPELLRRENRGWGKSAIQNAYEAVRSLASGWIGSEDVIKDFVQAVFSIKGLTDMVMQGNIKAITDRLMIMAKSKRSLHGIALDADGETFTKHASSVAGMPDLLGLMMQRVSSDTRIPVTKLFGTSAKGLAATGAGDENDYDEVVRGKQEFKLQPVHERLVSLILKAKDFKGSVGEDWKIEYKPLKEPTEKETSDLRYQVAQTDQIYINAAVLDPAEVRESRFGGDRYSMETELDATLDPAQAKADLELAKATRPVLAAQNPPNGKKPSKPNA